MKILHFLHLVGVVVGISVAAMLALVEDGRAYPVIAVTLIAILALNLYDK